MKILLTMNLPYAPALGGANKANRLMAEFLGRRGHTVRVVSPSNVSSMESQGANIDGKQLKTLNAVGRTATALDVDGVQVCVVDNSIAQLRAHFASELQKYQPDCILVSSEDPMQILLNEAVKYCPERVIYLAHTPSCLPFGPASFSPTHRGALLLSQVAAIVAVSRFCTDYIHQWSKLQATHIYMMAYGVPPFPRYGCFSAGYVTLVNPCAYKGISILLQLANLFPHSDFAAVPSWGTTREDLAAMRTMPNITVLDANPNIDVILTETQILMVPSLYLENFPMIIIEAMLRGIPVIASDVGGIGEAKQGTNYLIPVQPIQNYTNQWDEKKLWIPIIPAQDIAPWRSALEELLENRGKYEAESAVVREAAQAFVSRLNFDSFEQLLHKIASNRNT